jgi:predicted dehydrogenase
MNSQAQILVVGSGSAGQRHGRNLRQLGCSISYFDPRSDRVEEAAADDAAAGRFTDLDSAISSRAWDGMVVASPPNFHVDQILQILQAQRCPLLSEKPLSIDAPSAARLLEYSSRILLGYTYRWWPPLAEYRRRLQAGAIGRIRNMRFVMSAHLADWHPWEPYQDFFMAQKGLGGGALLDESHFIDLMLWFLGWPVSVYAQVDKISDLEIDSDDNVDILIRYASGERVNLHLDLIGRPHERSITAVGEDGSLVYSYEDNAILHGTQGEKVWETQNFECERNDMFMGVARDYLDMISGRLVNRHCTVEDGVAALKIVDACRQSSATGRTVALGGR